MSADAIHPRGDRLPICVDRYEVARRTERFPTLADPCCIVARSIWNGTTGESKPTCALTFRTLRDAGKDEVRRANRPWRGGRWLVCRYKQLRDSEQLLAVP